MGRVGSAPVAIPSVRQRYYKYAAPRVAVPLPCRFLDIPESAENLPKSEKMKFRQVGGGATTTNLSLSDETRGENKNQGEPKLPKARFDLSFVVSNSSSTEFMRRLPLSCTQEPLPYQFHPRCCPTRTIPVFPYYQWTTCNLLQSCWCCRRSGSRLHQRSSP